MTYLAIGVLVVVVAAIFLFPTRAEVSVSNISAKNQALTSPMVTATFTSSGAAVDAQYWIEKPGSNGRHCVGRVNLKADESREVSFECPGLKGHNGQFELKTGPLE